MNGKLLGGKRIDIVSVSDTHALVRCHWSKDLPLTRDFCLFAKGDIPGYAHHLPSLPSEIVGKGLLFSRWALLRVRNVVG